MNTLLFGSEPQRNIARPVILGFDDVDLVAETSNESEVLSLLDQHQAQALIVCADGSTSSYRVARQSYQLRPKCIVSAIASAGIDVVDPAMVIECGIRYVIDPSENPGTLSNAYHAMMEVEFSRQAAFTDTGFSILDSKVITIYGPKDGLGSTSLAANLGVLLARAGKKTILLDFDLQFGDCASHLGLNAKRTLTDLLQEGESPTIDRVRQNIALHSSGLNVLPAPLNPEFAEQITAAQLESVINTLTGYYDYVLIDVPSQFNDIVATCIDKSQQLLLITRASIPVLRHTKKALVLIDLLGQKQKVKCLMSPVRKGERITAREAEQALGITFWKQIPSMPEEMDTAINQGIPLVMSGTKNNVAAVYSAIQKEILQEFESLDPDATPNSSKERSGLFGRKNAPKPERKEKMSKKSKKDKRS